MIVATMSRAELLRTLAPKFGPGRANAFLYERLSVNDLKREVIAWKGERV